MRPAAVARLVDVKPRTAVRYFQDWKKQSGNLEGLYKVARTMMRRPGGFSPTVISILAEELGMQRKKSLNGCRNRGV
jgi:hypothetical protein